MKALVTGCAGFIGSNLVRKLLRLNFFVLGIDNFSTGKREFIKSIETNKNFKFIKGDLLDLDNILTYFKDVDIVFHFAANADVKDGMKNTKIDIEQNIIATSNVLNAIKINNIKKVVFSSTGAVYGEAEIIPTPENFDFPIQTSLYGTSKVAAEGLITSYAEAYDLQAWIFRFVSVLGPHYSHGHVFDFVKALNLDSTSLDVLGDGNQKKSYIHVNDCINGLIHGIEHSKEKINIFNLGSEQSCTVKNSINWIIEQLGVEPKVHFKGGKKGWPGDNPNLILDINKIKKLGWAPKYKIEDGIKDTVNYIKNNPWLFKIK